MKDGTKDAIAVSLGHVSGFVSSSNGTVSSRFFTFSSAFNCRNSRQITFVFLLFQFMKVEGVNHSQREFRVKC